MWQGKEPLTGSTTSSTPSIRAAFADVSGGSRLVEACTPCVSTNCNTNRVLYCFDKPDFITNCPEKHKCLAATLCLTASPLQQVGQVTDVCNRPARLEWLLLFAAVHTSASTLCAAASTMPAFARVASQWCQTLQQAVCRWPCQLHVKFCLPFYHKLLPPMSGSTEPLDYSAMRTGKSERVL